MQYFGLIWELARTDFKLRYNNTKIGYAWAVLKPLALFFIINFIFGHVFTVTPYYSLALLTGIMFWSFFAEGTSTGLTSLTDKSHLLLKIPLPLFTIILAQLLQSLIIALINMGIVAVFFFFTGPPVSLSAIVTVAVLFIATTGMILAFSLVAAIAQVRVRDTAQAWDIALRFGFYMAPIVYPLEIIPLLWQKILWVNPMSYVIHISKEALLQNHLPPAYHLWIILLLTAASVLVASLVYRYLSRHITDYL